MNKISNDIPIIIGFPRSGNHWIRIVLECYFNSISTNTNGESLLNYANLIEQNTPLEQNYLTAGYAIMGHDIFSDEIIEGDFIKWCIINLKKHYNKYLINAQLLIYYDKLKIDFLVELEKIINFLKKPWNIEKAALIQTTLAKIN